MPPFNKAFPPNVIAFTSDRTVDFAIFKDQNKLNEFQKGFLLARLNLDIPEPAYICQVHGDRVMMVGPDFSKGEANEREADGLLTRACNYPLAIRSADCLPVFLYDAKQAGIGLIHVGWKGCQKNISGQTIGLMQKKWRSNPGDIRVLFGPAIRSCCYETGEEFLGYFPRSTVLRDGSYYFDLVQENRNQLTASGVLAENIFDCNICTCCEKNYFSYRREGQLAGRMISLIMLKGE